MIDQSLQRLQHLVNTVPAKLESISEQDFCAKPAPGKWSKKEIIGHLIDSAANNHQRFIRIQYETIPRISYDQNAWNQLNHYEQLGSKHVIRFWAMYNQHLVEIIKRIPEPHLSREGNSGGFENLSLGWLINDYVEHMEHHLKQIDAGLV